MAVSEALAAQFSEWMSDSNNYPPQLGAWINDYFSVNPPNLPFSQLVGYQDAVASAYVKITSTFSVASVSSLAVQWTSTSWDTKALFSSGSNTRLTARSSGKWLAWGYVEFANNTTAGLRRVTIRANGGTTLAGQDGPPSVGTTTTFLNVTAPFSTNGGDYVELIPFQDSGGAINLNNASFAIFRVSP